MKKAILINNTVVNIIEIEEGAKWQPPGGAVLVDADGASTGFLWDGERFIDPNPPEDVAP